MNIFLYRMRSMTGKGSWASPLIVLGTLMEQDSILGVPSPQILSKDWLSLLGSVAYSWIHESWLGSGMSEMYLDWQSLGQMLAQELIINDNLLYHSVSIECLQCARSSLGVGDTVVKNIHMVPPWGSWYSSKGRLLIYREDISACWYIP